MPSLPIHRGNSNVRTMPQMPVHPDWQEQLRKKGGWRGRCCRWRVWRATLSAIAGARTGAVVGAMAGPVSGIGGAVIGGLLGGVTGVSAGIILGDVLDEVVL